MTSISLSTPRRLTTKQRAFVAAYLGTAAGNATKAAELAGYGGNEKSLAVTGSQLLRVPHVILALERITAAPGVVLTRNERQAFWSIVINSPKVSMRDRLKASEMLAKSQGDFIERREVLTKALSMTDDELRSVVRERLSRDQLPGPETPHLLTESVSSTACASGESRSTPHPGTLGGPPQDSTKLSKVTMDDTQDSTKLSKVTIDDTQDSTKLSKVTMDDTEEVYEEQEITAGNSPVTLKPKVDLRKSAMTFSDKLKMLLEPEKFEEGTSVLGEKI